MTCACPGNICTCDGTPTVKNGATFHLPLMLKDSAMTTDRTKPDGVTLDAAPTADMSLEDAMKLPRYAGMWPSQAQQYAARDLAMAKTGVRGSLDYQESVRDHYAEQMSDAWKGEALKASQPVDPAFAKDGRTFADLSDSEKARERMSRDMQDGWKR